MRPPAASRTDPVGSTMPPRRSAHAAGSALTRKVEGGLGQRRFGDAARIRLAIGRHPAVKQPGRDVEPHRVAGCEHRRALARDAPQQRVDKAIVALGVVVLARLLDGEPDGGVRRRREKEELRRAAEQNGPQIPLALRQRLFEEAREHRLEAAEATQHRGGDQAGEATVARRQLPLGKHLCQRVIKGAALVQHGGDEADGGLARRKPRRCRRGNWFCSVTLVSIGSPSGWPTRGGFARCHAPLAPGPDGAAARPARVGSGPRTLGSGRDGVARTGGRAGLGRHLLQRCDAVLGVGVRREPVVEPAAAQAD